MSKNGAGRGVYSTCVLKWICHCPLVYCCRDGGKDGCKGGCEEVFPLPLKMLLEEPAGEREGAFLLQLRFNCVIHYAFIIYSHWSSLYFACCSCNIYFTLKPTQKGQLTGSECCLFYSCSAPPVLRAPISTTYTDTGHGTHECTSVYKHERAQAKSSLLLPLHSISLATRSECLKV